MERKKSPPPPATKSLNRLTSQLWLSTWLSCKLHLQRTTLKWIPWKIGHASDAADIYLALRLGQNSTIPLFRKHAKGYRGGSRQNATPVTPVWSRHQAESNCQLVASRHLAESNCQLAVSSTLHDTTVSTEFNT